MALSHVDDFLAAYRESLQTLDSGYGDPELSQAAVDDQFLGLALDQDNQSN